MKIVRLLYGQVPANTYILGEEEQPCVVFDLGANPSHAVERYIAKHHGRCLGLFLTHGHFDHIAGLNELETKNQFPLFLHSSDWRCLQDPRFNGTIDFGLKGLTIEGFDDPYPIEDEDEIRLGDYLIRVIHTPYHTAGSCCFEVVGEKILITGDSLFRYGVGRDDLRGAEPRKKDSSLAKLKAFPPETRVYPGHGTSTTIGDELRFNSDFRDAK